MPVVSGKSGESSTGASAMPPGIPGVTETSSVGASATASTTTSMVWTSVVRVSPSASVTVAVTDKVKSSPECKSGVTFRSASCWATVLKIEPSSLRMSSIVQVTVPPSLVPGVPADRIAPSGTPEMVTDSVSEPSRSVTAAVISRSIALSSSPRAPPSTSNTGASATASTVTAMVWTSLVKVLSFSSSLVVADTDNVKSSAEFTSGVTVRPESWSATVIGLPASSTVSSIVQI